MESSSSSSKRGKALGQVVVGKPNCLVDGCNADLRLCRDYHRRHKVCEAHSKTPRVTIGGREQRFCQQCSRFHSLVEFDEGKRSCRKRLDGHNRRRRKPQPLGSGGGGGTVLLSFQNSSSSPYSCWGGGGGGLYNSTTQQQNIYNSSSSSSFQLCMQNQDFCDAALSLLSVQVQVEPSPPPPPPPPPNQLLHYCHYPFPP